ncbi:hypothetical protein JM47_00710 [Ureaplasma diversum]|uniref:Type I restriction modification DNA specificity domain-containing protein n=1 Tax=Ureaplasma diversum TaxID=42094 RepID=A0A0C5RQF7_9BACT|nr:hypothetical protein JM47_00710 [Ureaplasma diversum]
MKLLYDYWFTQFDFPDENGKPYKSSGGEMVWNIALKKNIPKEWGVKHLSELCDIVLGGTPSTTNSQYWNGHINWLNSGEISQFPVVASAKKITSEGQVNSSTKLMTKGTTVISITGNIRISYLAINSCANQSIVGILENNQIKCAFIHQYLSRLISNFTTISSGNCQKHINKAVIEEALILIPKHRILQEYYQLVIPLYENISNNALKNQELIKLRDFLLPLLMNGQATIKD